MAIAAIATAGSSDAPRTSANPSAGRMASHTTVDGKITGELMRGTLCLPRHRLIRSSPRLHLVLAP
jgi:hypothetical protein